MNSLRLSSFAALAASFALAVAGRADTTISTADTTAKTLSSGTLTVTPDGSLTVSGSNVAVTVTGNASIVNNGTIEQAGTGRGIDLDTKKVTLTIANNAGATIETADADAIRATKGTDIVTLNNHGSIISNNASAGGSQAVDWNGIQNDDSQDTLNNYSGGLLQATNADGVRTGVNTLVNNDGTIKSIITDAVNGSGSDGIDAQQNTGATIVNGNALSGDTANDGSNPALIEGGRHGITGGVIQTDTDPITGTTTDGTFTMSITNNVGGVIQGDNGAGINIDGFNAKEVVTIVNHGTITGNGVTGDGDGVDVDGVVNLTNTGTIHSLNAHNDTSEGVTVGGGTITNTGTIEGSIDPSGGNTGKGRGITIAGVDKDAGGNSIAVQAPYAATTITNQAGGLIKGDSDSGIAFTSQLSSGFSHTIANEAGATIQGGGTTVAAIVTAADKVTINNAGLIDGSSSGKAITGGSGGLVVNITGDSASVLGDITGAAGAANTLTIDPGEGNVFSYADTLANFSTTTVSSGTFSLSGQITLALNGAAAGDPEGYGQLIVNAGAALVLGGASQLNLVLGGFTPTVGEQFTVIDMVDGSSTIDGAFSNLADGGIYTQDGVSYLVSYEGGTGNDLVLTVTAIPEPATVALLLSGVAGAAAFVLRRRRAA